MRRFIRFMSEEELERFLKGEELVNETVHNGRIKGSFGFCFFDADQIDPITAQHALAGIATEDYMVEFLVSDDVAEKCLTKSRGMYSVPKASTIEREKITENTLLDNQDICILPEYCTKKYDRATFMPFQIWHLMMSLPVFAASGEFSKTIIAAKQAIKEEK